MVKAAKQSELVFWNREDTTNAIYIFVNNVLDVDIFALRGGNREVGITKLIKYVCTEHFPYYMIFKLIVIEILGIARKLLGLAGMC